MSVRSPQPILLLSPPHPPSPALNSSRAAITRTPTALHCDPPLPFQSNVARLVSPPPVASSLARLASVASLSSSRALRNEKPITSWQDQSDIMVRCFHSFVMVVVGVRGGGYMEKVIGATHLHTGSRVDDGSDDVMMELMSLNVRGGALAPDLAFCYASYSSSPPSSQRHWSHWSLSSLSSLIHPGLAFDDRSRWRSR